MFSPMVIDGLGFKKKNLKNTTINGYHAFAGCMGARINVIRERHDDIKYQK